MRRFPVALLVLASCRQVFGLEPPELGATDAAPAGQVTGRYLVRYVANSTTNTPEAAEAPAPSLLTEAILDDGSTQAVTMNADGTFSFATNVAGQRYRLRTGNGVEYQHDAQTLELRDFQLGRLDAVDAPPNTKLAYTLDSAVGVGRAALVTTGTWMSDIKVIEPTVTFDWSTLVSGSITPKLLSSAAGDRAMLLVLKQSSVGIDQLAHYRVDAVDQPGGTTQAINAPLTAVTPDRCADLDIRGVAANDRLVAAGADPARIQMTWGLHMHPAVSIAYGINIPIAVQSLLSPADVKRQLNVGTPVPGTMILNVTMGARRTIGAVGGELAIETFTGFSEILVVRPCTQSTIFTSAVALPGKPVIAGMVIDTDYMHVAIDRASPVRVELPVAVVGESNRTYVNLHEVQSAKLVSKGVFVTTTDAVTIDASLFEAGRVYVFSVVRQYGFPDAARGDFSTFGPPFGSAIEYSALFYAD